MYILSILTVLLDDLPIVPMLQQFTTSDGSSINLLQEIGTKSEAFGICLLDDQRGVKTSVIMTENPRLEDKMRKIFMEWLEGKCRRNIHVHHHNN